MRNVYFCNTNIYVLDPVNSWKAFYSFCWLWKWFPCKKVVEMFEEMKINRVDEAKLDSSIHSTFGALLLCQAVWRAGEMSSLCWSILAAGLAVLELLCTLIGCNVVSPGFKRLLLIRPAVNHTNQRPRRCFYSDLFSAGLRLTYGKCSVVSSSNTEIAIPSYPIQSVFFCSM